RGGGHADTLPGSGDESVLAAVLDHDFLDAQFEITVGGVLYGLVAKQRRLVGMGGQHDVAEAGGSGEHAGHDAGAGPQGRAQIGVEGDPGAIVSGPDDGPQQAAAGTGRENGEGDAGEIDQFGAFDRLGESVPVVGEELGGGGIAPIGEVTVAPLLMY